MCPRERFSLYKSLLRLFLCYKKDWATLLHLIYFCYLFLLTNYPITKLSVTTYFSTCRECLAENLLSFALLCTVKKTAYHFLLLLVGFDTLTYRKEYIDPLYLWVIRHGGYARAIPKRTPPRQVP